MIVLGMAEGGFLLLELLPALAVDVRQHSRSVARRRTAIEIGDSRDVYKRQ